MCVDLEWKSDISNAIYPAMSDDFCPVPCTQVGKDPHIYFCVHPSATIYVSTYLTSGQFHPKYCQIQEQERRNEICLLE